MCTSLPGRRDFTLQRLGGRAGDACGSAAGHVRQRDGESRVGAEAKWAAQGRRCVDSGSPFAPVPPSQVGGETVSSIGRGLLVLVGVGDGDGPADVDWLARKLLAARLFAGADGRPWAAGAADAPPPPDSPPGTPPGVDLLFVSQFTLYGSLKKGTKPDFKRAMAPDPARTLYSALLDRVRAAYEPGRVRDGVFGAMMQVREKRVPDVEGGVRRG